MSTKLIFYKIKIFIVFIFIAKNMEQDKHSFSELYNGFLTPQNNYVWGGAMCLAWSQLKNSIIKEPIQLSTNDKDVLQTINNFNAERFDAKDINPACVYIKSGFGKKTMDLINKEVSQKFPQKTTPPLDLPMQDDSIISYAYLLKKLQFLAKFDRLPDSNLQFNNQYNVHAFYASSAEHRKQISFSEYINRDNFVIAIKSKNPKDFLFVVKSQSNLIVEDVFKKCEERKLQKIGDKDQFMMPVVQLDLQHHFNELKLQVKNKGFTDYFIQEMFENLKIKIDESGAKVQNQAVIMMNRCMMMPREIKQFILDKPFWIVMKEEGKHPYLAVYIRNPVQKQ